VRRVVVFLVFWVWLVVACSGRSPDAGASGPAGPAGGGGGTGGGGGGAGSVARTPRPIDARLVAALAEVAIPGNEVTVVRRGAAELAAIVAAPTGVRVTVTASACLACTPVELAAWEARRAELAALWAPAVGMSADAGGTGMDRGSEGDRMEIGMVELAGQRAVEVSAVRVMDGETRHTVQLHWNDGATQLAVVCESEGCGAAARAVMEAYLGAM
jgi:hypothetical protein